MSNKQLKDTIMNCKEQEWTNKDIAFVLGVSERTVYRYLKEIREEEEITLTIEVIEFADILEIVICEIYYN